MKLAPLHQLLPYSYRCFTVAFEYDVDRGKPPKAQLTGNLAPRVPVLRGDSLEGLNQFSSAQEGIYGTKRTCRRKRT
jgi:hypothetical protein